MRQCFSFFWLWVICGMLLHAGCVQKGQKKPFGTITTVEGTVELFEKHRGKWRTVSRSSVFCSGDSIRTKKDGQVSIAFDDSSSIQLAESTMISIIDTVDSAGRRCIITYNTGGEIMAELKGLKEKGTQFIVRTPTAEADAEGTHFFVFFAPVPFITHVKVLHGSVRVFNPLLPLVPPVIIAPGFFTTVRMRIGPQPPVPLNYGQFKKMQRMLGSRRYDFYAKHFKVGHGMALTAPLVPGPMPPVPGMGMKVPGKKWPGGISSVHRPFMRPSAKRPLVPSKTRSPKAAHDGEKKKMSGKKK